MTEATWQDPVSLELATDHRRRPGRPGPTATHSFELPAALAGDIESHARAHARTPFVTMLAAYAAFLHRHTGRGDIVIGTPGAVRVHVDPDASFAELLGDVAAAVQDASADEPCQTSFAFGDATDSSSGPPLDVALSFVRTPSLLAGQFRYRTDLFDPETPRRWSDRLIVLTEHVVRDPSVRVGDAELLPAAERAAVLATFNDTSRPLSHDACLHELFAAQARRAPDAPAVVSGGETVSYERLQAWTELIAGRLAAAGVSQGDFVGVCGARAAGIIGALLGVLRCGASYVPLETDWPPERLRFMTQDCGVRVVACDAEHAGLVEELGLLAVVLDEGEPTAAPPHKAVSPSGHRNRRPPGDESPGDLAYVLYTSGSTGAPKGVAIPHRAVNRLVEGASTYVELGPGCRFLWLSPLTFDASVIELWGPLLTGGAIVITPPGRAQLERIADTIRVSGATAALFISPQLHAIVDRDPADLHGLRHVLVGGDVLSPDHVRRLLASGVVDEVVHCYGPTESTLFATVDVVREVAADVASLPIGRPIENTTCFVVDDRLRPVPVGVPGELLIGGLGLARGYMNREELTAQAFVPDPFAAGGSDERLYRSGDLARWLPDGRLEFLGRIDDQVKIRGYRIELGEIEAVLRDHERIVDCAVLAREDEPGHRRLVAYIVAPEPLDVGGLREFVARRLPSYMVPAAWVMLDALPLTSNNKVDRAALPAPGRARPRGRGRHVPPQTALESRMVELWSEALRVDAITLEDDFFELGGDSLLALQIIARLREDPGVEVPIDVLFDAPTPGGLARSVEEGDRTVMLALPRLLARPRGGHAPVSVSQAQVCFLNELDPASVAYQFQAVIWLHGTLDVAALSQALGEIVARHEIYRTTFPRAGGSWVQHVHEPFSVELPVHDLTAEPDADAALEQLAAERFTQRIAIDRLPLVRWTLARVGPERHALLHGEHHLVHDGWSMMVLLRELRELYGAAVEGRPTPLAAPAIQFADFAVWQHELLDTALAREQLAYWTRRLADAPDPLELPYDAPRPARQTFRGDQVCLTLPPELAARLRELAQEQRATLFTTMLAAFLVLLHRYSGASDVVVGSGLANRRLREVEDLIGMLVNTVALRVDLSGDPTVTELLARVRSTVLEAHVHQDVPFERVVEAVAPVRSASQGPLYQTLFSFADAPLPDLRAPGLQIVPDETAGNGSAKAEINVVVVNHSRRETAQDGELTLVWEYNSDLFSAATAQRAVAHYRTLLEAFVADPDRTVSALELADDAERGRLAAHAAGPAPAYERTATIAEIFEQRVAERPDAVAIVAHREQLTYGELNARANRLAHRLRTLGVTRETPVGICLERSPAMIVTLLGILKSGGAYVALDPSFPAPRVHLLAHDAGTAIICTESRFRDLVPDDAELLCFDELDLAGESDEDLPHDGAATDLAYIAYTSGSTGEPKGVEITHRAVARLVRGADYVELSFGEVLLALAPLAFDASTFEIWGALLNGGRLAIAPPGSLSPFEIAQAVRAHDVTTLWLTAGLFHKFVELEPETLGGVRQLVAGGDVLSPAAVARALEVLPADGVLVNGYGPTEGTTFTCCHRMRAGSEVSGPIPIGRPIANTRVHILDGHGQPVPVGVRGELHIGGDGVARGYRQRPELTAERFVPDPFGPQGGRLYRTGDLARWRADGVVEFLGRIDDQVKIRGFRVEPGEVESALASHPAVRDAAVVAQRRAGEDRRLVAYVVPRDGADANGRELRRFLAGQLPAHLVPSAWVTLDELALTPNGKIDRSGLLEPIADERAGRRGDRLEEPLERAVADIFERVLGVRPTPADDDFFDLGGHSLLAVELFAAIERDMGVRLPLATIFEAPTVHELAAVLGPQERVVPWSSLVGLTTTGSRIPFFAVTAGDGNAVGFGQLARHLGPEQPFYALQPRGLDGRTRLHTSVEAMARHCLTEVRGVQPEGPYLLGGRCLGGLIAFEMARRLEAIGEEVALLVVLDSLGPRWAPRPLADGIGYDEVVNLCRLRAAADGLDFGDLATAAGAREFIGWLREPAVVGDVPVPRYLHEAYLARPDVQAAYPDLHGDDAGRLMNWAWASGRHELGLQSALFGPPTAAAQRLRPERPSRARRIATRAGARAGDLADVAARGRSSRLTARREQRLNTIASAAAERYRAREYGGRITLIRSEEFLGDVEIARWHGVASGGLDEQLILGSHRSMLREPDVASLAARLADLFAQRTASRLPG